MLDFLPTLESFVITLTLAACGIMTIICMWAAYKAIEMNQNLPGEGSERDQRPPGEGAERDQRPPRGDGATRGGTQHQDHWREEEGDGGNGDTPGGTQHQDRGTEEEDEHRTEGGREGDGPPDGGSEGGMEEEIWCPDETSSASTEETMPDLEDVAKEGAEKTEREAEEKAEEDGAAHGGENGEVEAAVCAEERQAEKTDGEKTEEQGEQACSEADKEQTGQEQDNAIESGNAGDVQSSHEADGEKGEKEEKNEHARTEAGAQEPAAAKKPEGTKVLKKKKKKKTRSQPPPSLFSCPFMTSEMMEPSESRGPWRRRERGRGVSVFQAYGTSTEEDQREDLPPIQNGGTAGEEASGRPESDNEVEKVKEEIRDEACPTRKVYKEAERCMTDEDRETERRIQREQLAAIFKLMQDNEDKFGVQSYDDVEEQMKLYKT